MKKYLIAFLCFICIILVSNCNVNGKITPQTEPLQKEVILVSLTPGKDKQFKFGQLTESSLTLKNLTDKAMVITQVYIGSDEDLVMLSGSAYGSIHKSDTDNIYLYNQHSQQPTELSFYIGFLLPNQEVSILCIHRVLTENESLSIKYILSNAKYDGTPNSLKPFNVYLSNENDNLGFSEFHPFNENTWFDICRSMPGANPPGPYISTRAVIIPGLTYSDEPSSPPDENEAELKNQNSLINISIEDKYKMFPIESARKIASIVSGADKVVSIGYSMVLDGYVIFEKDLSWLLKNDKQKERGSLLPLFPLVLLKDIDGSNYVRVKVGDKQNNPGIGEYKTGENFLDTYPIFYGDGMYTRGEFIRINKTELLDFLKKVKGKDVVITQYEYFFHSRYYVLQLSREEQSR